MRKYFFLNCQNEKYFKKREELFKCAYENCLRLTFCLKNCI